MNIVTYGSLMFPSVMKAATGLEFPARKANVKNYGTIGSDCGSGGS